MESIFRPNLVNFRKYFLVNDKCGLGYERDDEDNEEYYDTDDGVDDELYNENDMMECMPKRETAMV